MAIGLVVEHPSMATVQVYNFPHVSSWLWDIALAVTPSCDSHPYHYLIKVA